MTIDKIAKLMDLIGAAHYHIERNGTLKLFC